MKVYCYLQITLCPPPQARRLYLLTSSWISRSQPAFNKTWTTWRWPLWAARCRGVRPCYEWEENNNTLRGIFMHGSLPEFCLLYLVLLFIPHYLKPAIAATDIYECTKGFTLFFVYAENSSSPSCNISVYTDDTLQKGHYIHIRISPCKFRSGFMSMPKDLFVSVPLEHRIVNCFQLHCIRKLQ